MGGVQLSEGGSSSGALGEHLRPVPDGWCFGAVYLACCVASCPMVSHGVVVEGLFGLLAHDVLGQFELGGDQRLKTSR